MSGICDGPVKNTDSNPSSSGAENIATGPKLSDQLQQQNLTNISKYDDRLASAVKGSGSTNPNFGIGKASATKADELGKVWVGDGYKLASDGKTLISADGVRRYRPPSTKKTVSEHNPGGDKRQANFETLDGAKIISNGHLEIE